jgi:hypothetical protein
MKTTIKAFCILLSCLFCATSFSSTHTYNFSSSTSMVVELPPNDPQIFYNFLLWRVKGNCEVISDVPENPLSFTMLSNKGTLNGVEFSPGDSLYLVATAGQRFELSADPRAKVEVTNLGTTTIKMKCSA